ncbi:MAG: dihydrofolate reductase family protein [Burkholderiaceae bacterium]
MNQSLDGFVDHLAFGPSPRLFEHFIEQAGKQVGSLYGRRIYEIMRYWDDDHLQWGEPERAFASAWRRQTKWVASRTLASVGPNAVLVNGDLAQTIGALKSGQDGEIAVAGPDLAASLTALDLIDEYRIYLHPVVLGQGTPYFAKARPRLRLIGHDRIDDDVIRLRYAPG